ncbi:MAG: helix-turn-helix domain-containing protein, partial [Pseudomonadota bacterium]
CTSSHGLTMSNDSSAGWRPYDVVIDCTVNRMVWHSLNATNEISIMLPCRDVGCDPARHASLTVYPAATSFARAVRAYAPIIVDACEQGDAELAALLLDGLGQIVSSLFGAKHPDPNQAGLQALKLRGILRFIDHNLADPNLSPTQLCKAFGVSRAALYRLFDAYGGVADHIRNRKLDQAYAKIIDLPKKRSNISAIASELGFYDHAHFSHRFKERFGFVPRELMEIGIRDAVENVVHAPSNDNDQTAFIDLVAGLAGG